MNLHWPIIPCLCAVLLAGCASRRPGGRYLDRAPVVVGSGELQQPVLFPEYFRVEGYTLEDHGHIPRTRLIGAGMTAPLELGEVRVQFNDLLHYYEWNTDKLEMGRQYFRIRASKEKGETVEIRGVQGSAGPTRIFLLYTPPTD